MAISVKAGTQRPRRAPWSALLQGEAVLAPLIFVVAVGAWEALTRGLGVPDYILPGPSLIARALVNGLLAGTLLYHLWQTLAEILLGFLLGSSLGLVFGALIAEFALVRKGLYPYIVAFQAMPKIAIAPLLIMWLGYGIFSKVVIAALVAFFPLLVNVIAGLDSIDQDKLDLMNSFDASRWDTFRMVKVPHGLPYVFAGLDVAIVFSVLGAIVGEFVGSQRGLGNRLLELSFAMDIPGVFSILIVLSVLGVGLHLIVVTIWKRVVFWMEPQP